MRLDTKKKALIPLLLASMFGWEQLSAQLDPWIMMGMHDDPWMHHLDPQQAKRLRQTRPGRRQKDQRGTRDHPRAMRERIEAMRMWKLTEYLELSTEQAEKFFPRTREHQQEMEVIIERQEELYQNFQKLIDEGKAKDRDVDRYIAEMVQLEKSQLDLRVKHMQSLKDILTDEQLAKFAVFNKHFRRQLRFQIEEELGLPESPESEGKED